MLVPEGERETLVAEMERRATSAYAPVAQPKPGKRKARKIDTRAQPEALHVVHPPLQKPDYVEQVEITYASPDREAGASDAARPPGKRKGA